MVTIVFKVITTIVHTKVYSQGYFVYTEIHWLSIHAIVISKLKRMQNINSREDMLCKIKYKNISYIVANLNI